jgi:hypothetical protein
MGLTEPFEDKADLSQYMAEVGYSSPSIDLATDCLWFINEELAKNVPIETVLKCILGEAEFGR